MFNDVTVSLPIANCDYCVAKFDIVSNRPLTCKKSVVTFRNFAKADYSNI